MVHFLGNIDRSTILRGHLHVSRDRDVFGRHEDVPVVPFREDSNGFISKPHDGLLVQRADKKRCCCRRQMRCQRDVAHDFDDGNNQGGGMVFGRAHHHHPSL